MNVWWDETFFPCREKRDRRITSVSVGSHANSKDIEDAFPSSPEFSKIQQQAFDENQNCFANGERIMDEFLQDFETSDKIQFQTKTVTVKLVGYEEACGQYVVQNKDRMEYLSPEELFNSMEQGQIFEVDDLVQQGTVSYLSDEEVIIESEIKAFQISLEDFKANLKEVYQFQKYPQEYDCLSEKLKDIILEQLIDGN